MGNLILTVKTTSYDSAEFLDSEEAIEEYLAAAFETADPAFIARCLGTVARARNMAELSWDTDMSPTALHAALSGEGNPEFATILKVMKAFGTSLQPRLGSKLSPAA